MTNIILSITTLGRNIVYFSTYLSFDSLRSYSGPAVDSALNERYTLYMAKYFRQYLDCSLVKHKLIINYKLFTKFFASCYMLFRFISFIDIFSVPKILFWTNIILSITTFGRNIVYFSTYLSFDSLRSYSGLAVDSALNDRYTIYMAKYFRQYLD